MAKLDDNKAKELCQLHNRFFKNLTRSFVLSIVATNLLTTDDQPELSKEGEDVIRAMIVFLHASLEDFLREMVRILCNELPESRLNKLQIKIGNNKGDKISLGMIAQHPAKCFADVLKESVDEWLSNKSFGNTEAVCTILNDLKIDYKDQETYITGLDKLMNRRHRIVHNADLECPTDSEPKRITLAELEEITKWFHDVDFFVTELVISMLPKTMAEPILARLNSSKDNKAKFKKDRKNSSNGVNDSDHG